jgi:hypothetical protein
MLCGCKQDEYIEVPFPSPSSLPETSISDNSSLNPSESTEPSKESASPEWYAWDEEQQFDPTLHKNKDRLWQWHHTEYHAFGDFSAFQSHSVELVDDINETSTSLTILLPPSCMFDDSGNILFDGQFAYGTIKIGYLRDYYKLQNDETLLENMLRMELFTDSLQPANERESSEIKIGAYTYMDGILRYICGALSENYRIAYIIPLQDGYITMLEFLVKVDMSSDDVMIYDKIASSISE